MNIIVSIKNIYLKSTKVKCIINARLRGRRERKGEYANMADILETIMLVCFGCSWPLSVYKNIKARSAKAMSLQFILLIIAGYIAGITAKILRGNFSYVLVMYVINLVIVSVNVVVYFINRRYDRLAQKERTAQKEAAQQKMRAKAEQAAAGSPVASEPQDIRHALAAFAQIDTVELSGGVVMFGGARFAEIPFAELCEDYGMDLAVHNRSIAGLRLAEAGEALEPCVLALQPQKVFLNLGEADLGGDLDALIEQYEWLLYTLHNETDAKLYLVGVLDRSEAADAFNERLEALAGENGCTFIDLTPALDGENEDVRVFEIMRHDMRLRPITMAEAMHVAGFGGMG